MADIRTALQKLNRGQALTDEEATLLGVTPFRTTTVTPQPSTGIPASAYGPGGIPIQAKNPSAEDMSSARYTARAKAAGLTPTEVGASGPSGPTIKTVTSVTYEGTGKNRVKVTKYSDGTETRESAPEDSTGKTVTSVTYEGTGKNRVKVTKYSDGTETREAAPEVTEGGGKKVVSTYVDPTTGDTIAVYDDGTTSVLAKGTKQLDAQRAAAAAAAAATAERKSAYDLLYQQFAKYGLQALVTPLESLIKEGVPASEFAIRLRETDAYQKRFAANKARINKGLAALSEAEYIGLEDQYQNIMRQYGMPESYYARGEMGRQEGFEKLIAGDVSAAELETRVSSAYNRVINANPEVIQSLKSYYPNITNGDILSYVLDPEKALTDINKKITAAEIGGAALGAGLAIGATRAEELGAFGVSKAQAQQGYQTIAELLPTAQKLGQIYAKQGLGFYDQSTAEKEVFGISGAAEAAKKRKQFTQLETAQFSGQVGTSGSALARERAGQFQTC